MRRGVDGIHPYLLHSKTKEVVLQIIILPRAHTRRRTLSTQNCQLSVPAPSDRVRRIRVGGDALPENDFELRVIQVLLRNNEVLCMGFFHHQVIISHAFTNGLL